MEKDFDKWNKEKKDLHDHANRPFCHAREIWWCAVGVNVGKEADGTGDHHDRPIVIIRPFSAETFFGIALIGRVRSGPYYFPVGMVDDRKAVVNLSQARLYDTKRLLRKIGTLEESVFNELIRVLALTLFPSLFPETEAVAATHGVSPALPLAKSETLGEEEKLEPVNDVWELTKEFGL